ILGASCVESHDRPGSEQNALELYHIIEKDGWLHGALSGRLSAGAGVGHDNGLRSIGAGERKVVKTTAADCLNSNEAAAAENVIVCLEIFMPDLAGKCA